MKSNVKKTLTFGLCATVLIGGIYVNGGSGFQADGGDYVKDYNVLGTTQGGETNGTSPRLITTIKKTVNWILGILGLIALILCLWGGFQMLTAAGDDGKVKTGKKILTQAAIGLAVIGLSWLFVSFIFRLINTVGDQGTGG